MMDVKKLVIEARTTLNKGEPDPYRYAFSHGSVFEDKQEEYNLSKLIVSIADHYEACIKSERLAVIAEIREWADNNSGSVLKSENNYVPYGELLEKLDEMEAQNG